MTDPTGHTPPRHISDDEIAAVDEADAAISDAYAMIRQHPHKHGTLQAKRFAHRQLDMAFEKAGEAWVAPEPAEDDDDAHTLAARIVGLAVEANRGGTPEPDAEQPQTIRWWQTEQEHKGFNDRIDEIDDRITEVAEQVLDVAAVAATKRYLLYKQLLKIEQRLATAEGRLGYATEQREDIRALIDEMRDQGLERRVIALEQRWPDLDQHITDIADEAAGKRLQLGNRITDLEQHSIRHEQEDTP